MIGMQFQETARRGDVLARQYRKAGQQAYKAGRTRAAGSLLTGGLALAERKEEMGTGWGGLFYKPWRKDS